MVKIDMEMPENCYDCPICYDLIYCPIAEKSLMGVPTCDEVRPSFCPLREEK